MVEFLSKFESRYFKIARVNSIGITKSTNFLLFRTGVRFRCDVEILKLTARALSIYKVDVKSHQISFIISIILVGKQATDFI